MPKKKYRSSDKIFLLAIDNELPIAVLLLQ